MNIYTQAFKTPFGELIIGTYQNQLVLCDWKYRKMRSTIDFKIQKALNAEYLMKSSDLIEKCIEQLNEYFSGNRKDFELNIRLLGTAFQQKVWNELIKIPYGELKSYLQLSNLINQPKAVRAVATANGANALSIIIPCHRIIGSNGDLVGYAGGLATKKKLLQLENPLKFTEQIELF